MEARVVDLRVPSMETREVVRIYQEQVSKFSDLLTETPVRKHYNVGVLHYDTSVVA